MYALKELDRLKKLEPTYNKEYPTNHRRYVTTAQEVVSRMSSTLSGLKKIVAEFRNKGKNKKEVSIMDNTPLYTGPYMQDLFGWDTYKDQSAQDLLQELNSFLEDAQECIDIAVKMSFLSGRSDCRRGQRSAYLHRAGVPTGRQHLRSGLLCKTHHKENQ